MSKGVRIGNTSLEWDEQANKMEIRGHWRPNGPEVLWVTDFDGGRELLDCLIVVFGRSELVYRYPEVR